MSEEQKQKISAAHKGRKFTPEHRAKLSEAHRGRPKSPEHRAALSESIRRAHARNREDQGPV